LQGKPAPDFALQSVAGKTERLTDLIKGSNGAMVFFWATWCPHCREQIAELAKRREEIEKDGIKIILVDIGEEANQVAAYLKRGGISFDVLLDVDSAVAQEYEIVGVPTFFFLSADGIVVASKNILPENYKLLFVQ
jgi:peroxiredoxin